MNYRLHSLLRGLRTALRSIMRYRAWLADDYDYDYSPLLHIIELKAAAMAQHHEQHAYYEGYEHSVAQLYELARVCSRLRADDYFQAQSTLSPLVATVPRTLDADSPTTSMPDPQRQMVLAALAAQEADLSRLGELLTKHVLQWWD